MTLDEQIRVLHTRIQEGRKKFDAGMKADLSFGELRTLFSEIRSMEKELEVLFIESQAITESKD